MWKQNSNISKRYAGGGSGDRPLGLNVETLSEYA